MRTIFLPTDFSPKSENAMKYVSDMFQADPVHYVLIHSYDVPYQPNEVIISSVLETLRKEVEVRLEYQAELLKSFLRNQESMISRRIGVGAIADMIQYNLDLEPDFVVMGIRGGGGTERSYMFGSNTLQVLKGVSIPVLAVPSNCVYKKFRHIVFGTDLKETREEVFAPMIRLLERTNARLIVIYVDNEGRGAVDDKISDLKSLLGERMEELVRVESQDISQGLQEAAKKHQADLIVMVDRKRNLFQRLFHRSVTKDIGWQTTIPMLVLHEQPYR